MNKKSILLVTSEFPPLPGGIGNHAYNLAKHLEQNGLQVSVIADQRSKSGEEQVFDEKLDFKIHRVRLHRLRLMMYVKRIYSLFKMARSSEVIIASGKFPLWIVAILSLFYKKNYIAIIHGSEVNFTNVLLKRSIDAALKRFTKIIAVSNYTRSLVTHLNLKNIKVIPNGFDHSQWKLHKGQTHGLKGQPKLITVGNITDRKGQLNVIKHLSELIKIHPNIHYHCVGLPTQKLEFLKEAKRLNVDNNLSFHGRIKHEDLINFYRDSDVFVMLSSPTKTGDVEGFGIAILEANYFGLPAIGSTNCGIEDAINNYRSGILVDPNDTQAFVKALNEVLSNKEAYKKEAENWASNHTWELIIETYKKEIMS